MTLSLMKEINSLSLEKSTKLNTILLQKIQEYDYAVKFLHNQNSQLEERNRQLELSLRQAGALLLNNSNSRMVTTPLLQDDE
mmetsp:Transcript_6490/g.7507  ORF Transcript_6490/g.7507 Transcript_6490/m.7507 type:complete len:82 (+) Transcript_6490:301-546(+)|eukprot:CAMPEP_0170868246 /NCGR_PEP_ID=MMETSP0734-20130129/23420_1 /TAXON_ID=186038 /ORGANISM="Fragilariopsis kerguelensis, Strain L26-C5" /LENGTH=81 /DNA_ID=CAMNT_0011245931 /DNA_START=216 /DNA_END=461 /DNA_ORIENTATION=-